MTKLICIIGTDGSGKTTLADSVCEALQKQDHSASRVWLGAESYLMAPVRKVLKILWSDRRKNNASGRTEGSGSQRTEYAAEIGKKNSLASRYVWAVWIYTAIVWTDYRLQLFVKRFKYRRSEFVVADRYLFDVAVNLGLTLGWSPEKVIFFIQRKLGSAALPAVRVFLRVEPEVSMARKDDVFDVDYLRLRLRYYDAIAHAFGFAVKDGTLPISQNSEWLYDVAMKEVAKPYVLYVHSNNVDVGGADKVLALMAEHMRGIDDVQRGYRVAVALRKPTSILYAYEKSEVPVILSPFVRPQLSQGVLGLVRLILQLPSTLIFFWLLYRREKPDIVHVNDLYDFLPALIAKLSGIPVVWHIRMILPNSRMRTVFAWLVARLSPVSISVSQAVRDHYFLEQIKQHRALVVHDLGNAKLIADDRDPSVTAQRPADLPEGGRLVLMIGRVEPWKGQSVFVEAVSQIPEALRQNTVFALVGGIVKGKEDYFDSVTATARKFGILVLGERNDVPDLLRAADVSVHASVSPDPFPGVVIESLLSGAATVASASGGATEMIEDGVHGYLSQSGDAKSLANILIDLLDTSESPRSRFGKSARCQALGLVDASVVDAAVSQIYDSLFKIQN